MMWYEITNNCAICKQQQPARLVPSTRLIETRPARHRQQTLTRIPVEVIVWFDVCYLGKGARINLFYEQTNAIISIFCWAQNKPLENVLNYSDRIINWEPWIIRSCSLRYKPSPAFMFFRGYASKRYKPRPRTREGERNGNPRSKFENTTKIAWIHHQ